MRSNFIENVVEWFKIIFDQTSRRYGCLLSINIVLFPTDRNTISTVDFNTIKHFRKR